MAAKLFVAVACFALCSSSPVLVKGYLYRDGRGFSIGQGYTNNYGGQATGSATINGGVLQAYGSATTDDHNILNRNLGYEAFPGQAVAKAEVYDTPQASTYGSAKAVAEAQNTATYYAVPAPATIVSYEQNFEVPNHITYTVPLGGVVAESSAVSDGISETSITSARTDGSGSAESTAKTQGAGSYGITSSNAKTFGGYGSASSNANNAHGTANTVTRTQGFGSASSQSQNGLGLTSAQSQSNGGYASSSANNAADSAVASANSQGYGSASSNADLNNVDGVVVSSAKTTEPKGIHWKFGSAYGTRFGQVQANSQANGGSAKSAAQTNGYGNTIQTTADTQGAGSANANANMNGAGYVNSAANTNGLGYGSAQSTASNNGYGAANAQRFDNLMALYHANHQEAGLINANARADVNSVGQGSVTSSANSNGYGSATSTANSGPAYGALRYDGLYHGAASRLNANAHTSGQGSATSSAKTNGINTAYRVVNSAANTFGHGMAQANASA